jgi:hypothetical protein
MSFMDQSAGRRSARLRRGLWLGLFGAAAVLLGACQFELASSGCGKAKSNVVYAGAGGTCELRYDRG